jgi:hypothetical protein
MEDMAAPSNMLRQANRAMPGASRLMATPETVWSAVKVTDAKAWSAAMSIPQTPANKKPSHGLPVRWLPATPAKAPTAIMPSMAMLVTPERSETTPPRAPNT